jgi:hypothetical protein
MEQQEQKEIKYIKGKGTNVPKNKFCKLLKRDAWYFKNI